MLARIRGIWHDPVWSKVIAVGIVAALTGAWAFRADVASAFGAVVDWLTKPRRLAVGDLLLAALFGAIAGAALFRRSARNRPAPEPAVVPEPPVVPEAPDKESNQEEPAAVPGDEAAYESIDSWYTGFRAVEGRFAEREEYTRRSVGRRVRWHGSVFNVDVFEDNSTVLSITDGPGVSNIAYVDFPAAFRERVIALRAGDRVLVTGTIKSASAYRPRIVGEQLDVVP
jgi:hypothetical protein